MFQLFEAYHKYNALLVMLIGCIALLGGRIGIGGQLRLYGRAARWYGATLLFLAVPMSFAISFAFAPLGKFDIMPLFDELLLGDVMLFLGHLTLLVGMLVLLLLPFRGLRDNTSGAPKHIRPPCWNVVSLTTPFAGFLCGFFVGTAGHGILWHGHPIDGIFWGVAVWAVFCVLGLVAVGIAGFRSERLWGITAVGLILNAILPLVILWEAAQNLLNWWRYS
ncbi:MAG: hypothetical protein L0Y72_32005 [Gemmataceae bacterium]|nr:hypothetical protein [Gemmataceae bacterium]MCI0743679.1 hypothetical protein [Gemmataceae bacterium]